MSLRSRPSPGWHPLPMARMGSALLATCWTLARVGCGSRPDPALQAWARRVLALLGIRVNLERPLPEGGQLWVSNHLSWADPLVYLSLRPARILTKREVAGYPGIGPGARKAGLRFVCRENPFSRAAALSTLRRDLDRGEGVLLFPEGTTTLGADLAPLHEGCLRLAYRMGVKVLPLRLASGDPHYPWVGEADLMPHIATLAGMPGTRVHLSPGPVLDPRGHADEDAWVRNIHSHLTPHEADLEC